MTAGRSESATVDQPVNPNTLGDREAMGLPPTVVTRLPEYPLQAHHDLLGMGAPRLVAIVEAQHEPFLRRYAAGTLLGLIGDPRVRPLDPPMVDVPGREVHLGLEPSSAAEVVAHWRHVGVVEPWIAKECPAHTVVVGTFRIARYPVTNAEYHRFLTDTGARWLPTSWRFGVYPDRAANHPVWSVPPVAADAYADWLATCTGRGFRLPTEPEWELAASGGDGREHPWGDEFVATAANTVEAGPLTTTPIGCYPGGRSPFGADDMAGNVEELVADNYHAYPAGTWVDDDLARGDGTYRIARGGSFSRYGDLTRCRRRHGYHPRALYACGFRLAETV